MKEFILKKSEADYEQGASPSSSTPEVQHDNDKSEHAIEHIIDKKQEDAFLKGNITLSNPLMEKWVELGLIIEWISMQSSQEVSSLSDYLAEKTGDIVENFRSISKEAKDQSSRVQDIVDSSTNIVLDGQEVALVDVVGNLDRLLSDMIKDILDIARKAMDMVFVMQEVVDDAKKINEALDDIFKITKNTKYLSVNALIEAARAGEAGKGFAIVANEVGSLSSDTEALANKMNELISGFSAKLTDGFRLLEEIASKDLTPQLESKESIDKTMRAMIEQANTQKKILENTVTTSNNISNAVTKLIMATQFQDYAAQRLQHIVGANDIVVQKIRESLEETKGHENIKDIPLELSEEGAKILLDRFSLSALKEKFLQGLSGQDQEEATKQDTSSSDHDDEDDIELF